MAQAALELGHRVTVVSGPVDITYPSEANRVDVVSTEEMLDVCIRLFPRCDGMIGAAAPLLSAALMMPPPTRPYSTV